LCDSKEAIVTNGRMPSLPTAGYRRYQRLEAIVTKRLEAIVTNGWKPSLPTAGSHRYQRQDAIATGIVEKVPISSSRARR